MPEPSSLLDPMPPGISARRALLIGHRPFIDFANSSYCPEGTVDPIGDWSGLLHFLALTGLIGRSDVSALENYASRDTGPVLSRARDLRTALKQMNAQIIGRSDVSREIIDLLSSLMAHNDGGFRLQVVKGNFTMAYAPQTQSPSRILGMLGQSAADFLCTDRIERLRQCAATGCSLHFYDTSKNGRRRWCRMEVCGNRAKASEYYQRSKQSD